MSSLFLHSSELRNEHFYKAPEELVLKCFYPRNQAVNAVVAPRTASNLASMGLEPLTGMDTWNL